MFKTSSNRYRVSIPNYSYIIFTKNCMSQTYKYEMIHTLYSNHMSNHYINIANMPCIPGIPNPFDLIARWSPWNHRPGGHSLGRFSPSTNIRGFCIYPSSNNHGSGKWPRGNKPWGKPFETNPWLWEEEYGRVIFNFETVSFIAKLVIYELSENAWNLFTIIYFNKCRIQFQNSWKQTFKKT